jgi:hypothetical protein
MLRLCRERSCSYPGRSACLSFLIGAVEPNRLGIVLTWQKSAEDENPGNYPGERSEGSVAGGAYEL